MALAASGIKSYLWWAGPSPEAAAGRRDSRFHERFPVKYRFNLVWKDGAQVSRTLAVRGKNMSESGLLVNSNRRFATGAVVVVFCPELQLMGSASVRHCRRSGFKYRVGLEFRQPLMRTF